MKDFATIAVRGSGDCNSEYIKRFIKGFSPNNIKVSFQYDNDTRPIGTFTVKTDITDKDELDKLFEHIQGMASHAIRL